MRSKLFNLACLIVAVLAICWTSYGLLETVAKATGSGRSLTTVFPELVPSILLLAGLLFLGYTLVRFPSRNRVVNLLMLRSQESRHIEPAGPTGVEVMEAELDKITTLVADDIDFELPNTSTYQVLNTGDSAVKTASTNISEFPVKGAAGGEFVEFHSMDPLKESSLLVRIGDNDRAIGILTEAFAENFGPHDKIALALLQILDDEIENEATSARRLKDLYEKRDRFLKRLPEERGKLSDETWLKIHMKHPIETDPNYFYPEIYKEAISGF